ncbi:hypothetical protein [Halobacteriovorax sp. CON-3]|uniref:hypothetical protein n=1 Tax=Halobacteriovorax sp. CON-3 TaxID=3157710 RepID=UPI003720FB72
MNEIARALLEDDERVEFEVPSFSGKSLSFPSVATCAVFFSIIAFELMVIFRGKEFYSSIGFTLIESYVLAFTVEAFYMYFSAQKGRLLKALALILFAVSVVTLSYYAYQSDKNVNSHVQALESDINDVKANIERIDLGLKEVLREKSEIRKDMIAYRDREFISKGNAILKPRREAVNERESKLLADREEQKKQLRRLEKEYSSQGVIKNLSIITMKTIITIVVFGVLQLAICLSLNGVLEELRSFRK